VQHALDEQRSETGAVGVLGPDEGAEQNGQVVITDEHLGGVAFDEVEAPPGVIASVQEVAAEDEAVAAGLEAAVVESGPDDRGMTMGVGYDEGAHTGPLSRPVYRVGALKRQGDT
jgi:hypothetical protein